MMIPIIHEKQPAGKIGKPFYICMSTILPSVLLVVFNALIGTTIKKIEKAINENDFITNESLKDVKFRAKFIMGISAVLVASLVTYSFQHVSNVSTYRWRQYFWPSEIEKWSFFLSL